jgi:hypothetical protein
MKNIYLNILILSMITLSMNSQVRIGNSTSNSAAANSSAFIDASSNTGNNNTNFRGKGIVFPRTDLTQFTTFGGSPIGIGSSYPTRYDGFIVYNTATSGVAGIGNTEGTLTKGFWYYDNPTPTGGAPNNSSLINAGTWRPLRPSRTVVNNNVSETGTVIENGNGPVSEWVARLDGVANGTTTEIDLGTNIIPANTVYEFRQAKIYDKLTGELLLVATGRYDSATNVLVTGDAMVNKLLPAGTYAVELYFLPNTSN